MLIDIEKNDFKAITFKIDIKIVDEFRELCKKHKIPQKKIIEKAMITAIKEFKDKDLKDEKK